MKTKYIWQVARLLLLIIIVKACAPEVNKNISFENHLIPSIQVQNELRYYDLKDRMKHYNVPGISVVIIKNGEIALNKGYGISRLDDSTRVTRKTIFQAGSIAKSITAVGVMSLVRKGALDLDGNIEEYIKNWNLPENPYRKPITLRMLLSHTSGMINNNYKGFPQDQDTPSLNMVLDGIGKYKPAQLDTVPGTKYQYSNVGYGIVQRIVEDVIGKPFEVVMKEEVFVPFDMTSSTFERRKKDQDYQISYAYNRKGEIIDGYWYNAGIKASGGLWTTAEDLAKFMMKMQLTFSRKEQLDMLTPVKANYGLGFNVKGTKDSITFYHSGKNVGYTNFMIGYALQGDGVIVLTNADNGGYLFSEIIRGISDLNQWDFMKPKELKTVPVKKEILKNYEGTYTLHLGGELYTLKVKLEGAHLILIDLDESNQEYPLRALSETKFRDINDGEKVDFIKGEDGNIILLWDEQYQFKRKESLKEN